MIDSAKKAFTLVELVLAIMLTVIVVVVASAGARSLYKAKHKFKSQEIAFSQAMFTLDIIGRDLSNIYREYVDGNIYFQIQPSGTINEAHDRLAFHMADVPVSDESMSYIKEIEYGLLKSETNIDEFRLGRRSAVVEDLSLGNKGGKIVIIADSIKSMLLESWDGQTWSRGAPVDGSIPKMIKVTLGLNEDLWVTGKPFLSKQISLLPIPLEIDNYDQEIE